MIILRRVTKSVLTLCVLFCGASVCAFEPIDAYSVIRVYGDYNCDWDVADTALEQGASVQISRLMLLSEESGPFQLAMRGYPVRGIRSIYKHLWEKGDFSVFGSQPVYGSPTFVNINQKTGQMIIYRGETETIRGTCNELWEGDRRDWLLVE